MKRCGNTGYFRRVCLKRGDIVSYINAGEALFGKLQQAESHLEIFGVLCFYCCIKFTGTAIFPFFCKRAMDLSIAQGAGYFLACPSRVCSLMNAINQHIYCCRADLLKRIFSPESLSAFFKTPSSLIFSYIVY